MHGIAVIGASAGGPRVLNQLFWEMPCLKGCMIVVQHMPKFINAPLAEGIGQNTGMRIKIAESLETLVDGTVYVAPSERHLVLENNRFIQLRAGEKVNYVCPSVDVTMQSLEASPPVRTVGVVLTGMGRDGADGIVHIKRIHGITVAQDEKTSTIFGMPKEAIATGFVDYILPPEQIRDRLIRWFGVQSPTP